MGSKGMSEKITNGFLTKTESQIAFGEFENKIPKKKETSIEGGYKINTDGEIRGKTGKILKYRTFDDNPIPYITLKTKKGNKISYKTVSITKMMGEKFGIYISGYGLTRLHPDKEYMIVPKNGDWNNMKLDNLMYILKKNSTHTKISLNRYIQRTYISRNSHLPDENIAKALEISIPKVSEFRKELGLTQLNRLEKEFGRKLPGLKPSAKTYNIYFVLLKCEGEKSDLEIAEELRLDEKIYQKTGNKKEHIRKVKNVREKLLKLGYIKYYNSIKKKLIEILDK